MKSELGVIKKIVEEVTPEGVQGLWAGLHPERVYMEQPRMWAVWLLRGIFAVALLLGLLGLSVAFFGAK